jgi:hypothetical protein
MRTFLWKAQKEPELLPVGGVRRFLLMRFMVPALVTNSLTRVRNELDCT